MLLSPRIRRVFWRGIAWPNRLALVRALKRGLGRHLFSITVRNSLVEGPDGHALDDPQPSIDISVFFVGRCAGQLCVCRMWEPLGLDGWWLSGLWVHPALRGMGLAERLMACAEREAARAGISELWLDTNMGNTPAVGLCRKVGYQVPTDDSYRRAIAAHQRQAGNPPGQLVMHKCLATE